MPRHLPSKGAKAGSNNPLDLMREQMDELMGKNRNMALEDQQQNGGGAFQDFNDPKVDKYYLCGCSPYELLKGTKSEVFPQLERDGFLKERSDGMRMRWEMLSQDEKNKFGFERDLFELLTSLVEEQDKRVERLRERYDRENKIEVAVDPELKREIESLKEQITELLTHCEVLGEAGNVDDAVQAYQRSGGMALRLTELERRAMPREPKKQYVDDVSGLVYSSTDNEARIADLQAGKQYKAWKAIREKLLEMRANPPPGVRVGSGGGGGGRGDRDGGDRDRDYYDPRGRYDDRRGSGGGGRDDYDRGRGRRDDYDDRRGGYDDHRRGYDDRRRGYDDRRGGYDDRRGYR